MQTVGQRIMQYIVFAIMLIHRCFCSLTRLHFR